MEASTVGAPAPLALPQHMLALRRANEIRLGHASLKRDIRTGRTTVIHALVDPRAQGSITVADLLRAQRRWGAVRARKFLQTLALSEMKRVDHLTERQRALVVTCLPRA